ncbi:MAG: hypothetical protein M1834_009671 [Cirrosporium novae-zelandiae]|nr:MAG: hypothetical protein M1834_009671 [Cirrosporium novae-zelandiae]
MSGPDIILQRALLAQSDISPSFLTQTQVHGDESGLFSHIGFGRCGHVFAIGGTCVVAKVAIDKDDLELWDDARMHQKIWESFQTHAGLNHVIQIPKSPNPMTVKDPTTQRGGQTTLGVLISERILPMPKLVRGALVDKYCPLPQRQAAKTNPMNDPCVISLYLGERRGQRPYMNFGLRNFPLYLD